MKTYRVTTASRVAMHDPMLGRIRERFKEGEHTPTSEAQERALEHLVRIGLAETTKASAPSKPDPKEESS